MASHACLWNTAYKDSLVHVLATEYAADIDMCLDVCCIITTS